MRGTPFKTSETGTGSAINVSLGFIPTYVKVIDATNRDAIWEWTNDMADGVAAKTTTAVANLSSNGISAYAGDNTTPPGITLGSDVSVNGATLSIIGFYGDN